LPWQETTHILARVPNAPRQMTFVFLVCFISGLLLGVRVMLYGVERPRAFADESERSFRVSPASLTAFLIVFGAAGYVQLRGGVGPFVALLIAVALAALSATAAVRLVKRWWSVTPEHDVDDPRYVLQGLIARVVAPIAGGRGDASGDGEVAFEVGSKTRVVRARAVDDGALEAGTEVVIERIEGDVAYVESWAQVEKRL
jgi:membrane protein implicated in regulation of membrane protease activity